MMKLTSAAWPGCLNVTDNGQGAGECQRKRQLQNHLKHRYTCILESSILCEKSVSSVIACGSPENIRQVPKEIFFASEARDAV